MKRLLAMGLSFGLLWMLPQSDCAAAQTTQLAFARTTIIVSAEALADGDVYLSVPLSLSGTQSLAAWQGTICMDAPLELASFAFAAAATVNDAEADWVPSLQRILWMAAANHSAVAGTVGTVTMIVPMGTTAGTYHLSMQDCYAFDAQAAALPVETSQVTVTVQPPVAATTPHGQTGIPAHCGDVNLDGVADPDDAILCLRYYLARMTGNLEEAAQLIASDTAWQAADVNQSGVIDPDDAVLILRFYVENLLVSTSWADFLQR